METKEEKIIGQNKKDLYIVLDESGAMHLKNERYFIIGGFYTSELHDITSFHKNIEKNLKLMKNIPLKSKVELKSSKLNKNQYNYVINSLINKTTLNPISIVIDKYNLYRFQASENTAYNLFVKFLLKYLFTYTLNINEYNYIYLRLDNRSVRIKELLDLETYLRFDLLHELNFIGEFKVEFLNSSENRDVQVADFISNYIWKYYNKNSLELKFKKLVCSKFPYKYFGK